MRPTLLTFASLSLALDIHVSPTGSDTGDGSAELPLASIQGAVNAASPGDTIYLRGGTYSPTTNIQINKSGTAAAPYIMAAYDDGEVIIDGEALPGTPADLNASLDNKDRGILHIQNADYWRFYGLTFIHGPYGVYQRDGNNNYYESIVTHDNYESGFQIQGTSANNQVLYLDSYNNRDPRKNGESADGLAIKEGEGEGNIVIGARLWNNVDDGLDLWEFGSAVTIQDTIAWGNGFNRWGFDPFEGDGNGFKLGGNTGPAANHLITNCIAFGNAAKGFTDNKQLGEFSFTRNTAWNNPGVGFQLVTTVSTLTGNIAASNYGSTASAKQVSFTEEQTESGNSWQDGTTWQNASFLSIDTSLVSGPRQANGKISPSHFLLPASGKGIGATTHW